MPLTPAQWRRRGDASVARRVVMLLVLMVLPLGPSGVLDGVVDGLGGRLDERTLVGHALGLGSLLIALAGIAVSATIDMRRVRRVAAGDGRVEPGSAGPLSPRRTGEAAARTYWWTWLVTHESPSLLERRRCDDRAGRRTPIWTVLRGSVVDLAVPVIVLLVMPPLSAVLTGRSVLSTAALPVLAFGGLAALIIGPRMLVAPDAPRRRCLRCRQRLLADSELCPECGAGEPGPGADRVARDDPSRRVVLATLAAIVVGGGLGIGAWRPIVRSVDVSPVVPTRVLLADLESAPDWPAESFARVTARPLDAGLRGRLASLLLERRRAGARVGSDAWAWFDAESAAGRLDPGLRDRRWTDAVDPLECFVLLAEGWGHPARGPVTDAAATRSGTTSRVDADIETSVRPAIDPAFARTSTPATRATTTIPAADPEPGRREHSGPGASSSRLVRVLRSPVDGRTPREPVGRSGVRRPAEPPPAWLGVRFARRFDTADGGSVIGVVSRIRVGDAEHRVPLGPDGSPLRLAAGDRPSAAEWMPAALRRERPWPSPPEYVLRLPLTAAERAAVARSQRRGTPLRIELEIVRCVPGDASGPDLLTVDADRVRLSAPAAWSHRGWTTFVSSLHPTPEASFVVGRAGAEPAPGDTDRRTTLAADSD